jgi:hypothetical protein
MWRLPAIPAAILPVRLSSGIFFYPKFRMSGFKLCKEFSRWPQPSFSFVLQALANAFLGISLRGNIELPLICFVILHHTTSLLITITPA